MEPEKKVTGPSFEISMPFVYPSNVCDVVPYFRVVPRIMQQPEEFLDPQNAPKSLAAGASPQAPLGELTVLPRPPSWIQGVPLLKLLLLRRGEGRGREGRAGQGEGLPRLEITSGYALVLLSSFFILSFSLTPYIHSDCNVRHEL